MSKIKCINYETESAEIKEAYDAQMKASGCVTNMKKTLSRSLPAYKALMEWFPLRDEVQKIIGARGVVIFCHGISNENECLICSTYFRREFVELGFTAEEFEFSEQEKALEAFGRRMVSEPNNVDDALFAEMQKYFSEEEIVLITAFGSIMIATNLINNVLKIDLDDNLASYVKKDGV